MAELIRSIKSPCPRVLDQLDRGEGLDVEAVDVKFEREWLVTNGLGGYASGTVCGVPTRRYHGLLIAALPTPLSRTMMLNHLDEQIVVAGHDPVGLLPTRFRNHPDRAPEGRIVEFRLELGLPVWQIEVASAVIEKRLLIPHLQNTVHLCYRLVEARNHSALGLRLRPLVHFRSHEAPVGSSHPGSYRFTASENRYEISAGQEMPRLRMILEGKGAAFTLDAARSADIPFPLEAQRGYESTGEQWSPGFFHVELTEARPVALIASVERWETLLAMSFDEVMRAERGRRHRLIKASHLAASGIVIDSPVAATYCEDLPKAGRNPDRSTLDLTAAGDGTSFHDELVLAADQFLIVPAGRIKDAARAHAAGEEVRTVIAGYHWFTDWGRDTMISLEGLTLTTGRAAEAGFILRTFADYIRDGLIPNVFPEGDSEGLYHTADASLWFFHAVNRYLEWTRDRESLLAVLPSLLDIAEHHIAGTRFGIGVDPDDGLLRQGADGFQLTWMDAKVGDWVVTPRRGKAVEINALWYNALRLLESWLRECRGHHDLDADRYARAAEVARHSFNHRFWYESGGYLYDVVDAEHGDETACRPNQLFAFSLKYEVLDRSRWESVLKVVHERLLTPVGLRSLAPGEPEYKPRYFGDLRARDAAYHQGTVWAWLIGPFVDAWLKVHPDDRPGARGYLKAFGRHLNEAALGTISEVFDAECPYAPRGCVAQAWSVAEVLRAWVKTAEPSRAPLPSHTIAHCFGIST
jgi:glycogen debranching enzyme